MLFSVPIFTVSNYITEPSSYDFGLSLIYTLGPETKGGQRVFLDTIDIQSQLPQNPLILLYINPNKTHSTLSKDESSILQWHHPSLNISSLRKEEKEIIFLLTSSPDQEYLAVYDIRQIVQLEAKLGIATTFLVCTVLGAGAMMFSKLTNDLVISPIENMIQRVNNITKDPLLAAHDEEERLLFEEMEMVRRENGEKGERKEGERKEGQMETAVLEETLSKIGALLALGFGEAGSKIIAQNMEKGDQVNPMLPGIKEIFIFGFCDIRNFTDATEVLEEGVMLFVNEIGEIVH